MTRREPFTFIDFHSNDEPRKAFCRICEELTGRLNKLVPRLVDGIEDDKFKICSYCGEIYPIYDVKYASEYEPKGYISDNPFECGAKVSVVNRTRANRSKHRSVYDEIEIPKLAGKPEVELESMLKDRTSILLDLNDDDIRDSE